MTRRSCAGPIGSPPSRPHPLCKTRPATASSRASSAGSRLSGAVISALSSARSQPWRHGPEWRASSGTTLATSGSGARGIGVEHRQDHLDRHRVMAGMPAIVIGDHRHGRVADLGLAGELGLRHVGHADHVAAPAAIELALGQGRELRPLHDDIGAAALRRRCRRAAPAAASASPIRPQTGCAIETCATQPGPKKLFSRAKVRSMNWSITTKSPGAKSSRRLPTADSETMSVTPQRFSASILARKLIADGGNTWPRPCRGRNTTGCPSSVPKQNSSEVRPNGLSTRRQATSASPSIW